MYRDKLRFLGIAQDHKKNKKEGGYILHFINEFKSET
jgi:hypothetical protein